MFPSFLGAGLWVSTINSGMTPELEISLTQVYKYIKNHHDECQPSTYIFFIVVKYI